MEKIKVEIQKLIKIIMTKAQSNQALADSRKEFKEAFIGVIAIYGFIGVVITLIVTYQ